MIYLSPSKHDKIISYVSHLPHVVAFSLIQSITRKNLPFASGGLKDTTRIASSPAELWSDIFLTNAGNVLLAIKGFTKSLSTIKTAVLKKDVRKLQRILRQDRTKRQLLNS